MVDDESKIEWASAAPGIPDSMFVRGEVPMTKEEIRAMTISKARLNEGDIVYDIGAGTGSITVEAALMARRGHVYAVERLAAGVELVRENAARFRAGNVTVIHGEAPEALQDLPPADRIIIGGSGGNLPEIIEACQTKLKAQGRLVINAVTLETLNTAISLLEARGYDPEAVSITVSRLEKVGQSHMFKGLNPVYIISAQKENLL